MENYRLYRWMDASLQPTSIFAIVLLPLVWCVLFYETSRDEKQAEQEGRRDGSNIARLVENHVYRIIKRIDDRLLLLSRTYPGDDQRIDSGKWVAEANNTSDAASIDVRLSSAGVNGSTRPLTAGEEDYSGYFAESSRDDPCRRSQHA